MDTDTINNRYILKSLLGTGGMGAVYRAYDRLTGEEVALKQVSAPPVRLGFASRAADENLHLALAQEFKTLSSLRHPHIVSVRDYGFDEQRQPFFTMDLIMDPATIIEAGQGQPLEVQVDLLIQLLQALAYLHRRGVLHRDLKPGNVLVIDGQVKVLDFGISLITEQSVAEVTQPITGTFAYMAPELLEGMPPSTRSDLYAVGILAYEILTRQHPFNTDNMVQLISQIMTAPIDMDLLKVDDELVAVISRLLDRSAQERYKDANATIKAFCVATDKELPKETASIRESFLQAAKFVGREREMASLTHALHEAMQGRGSTWLIGGESGVGKSRLCDEFRSVALVEGALVVRGQTLREGGSLYHIWRNPLRRLVITNFPDDNQSSILKSIVSDISNLVGHEIPDAPPLDPQAAQIRLLRTTRDLFKMSPIPVVVILEDLQWAESNSLAVLDRLSKIVADAHLLILGNYRNDEAPDLPESIPGVKVLEIHRLTKESIVDLTTSMLGPGGRDPRIIELMQRETEGNPFFLVETVRTLAEEAGQLDQISHMTLPERVIAGGIQEIVQRRLSQVSPKYRNSLQLAAVAGREIDLDVMHKLSGDGALESWLNDLAEIAVFDVLGSHWRFAHDKLREGVIDEISEDSLSDMHRRVAEAIEETYPDYPEYAASLAYQWAGAKNPEKELQYSELAGLLAFQNYANEEAITYLRRALELLADTPESPERVVREVGLQTPLSVALMDQRGYSSQEVGDAWSRTHELCQLLGNAPQLAPALFGLTMMHILRGEYHQGLEVANQILLAAPEAEEPALLLSAGHFALGWMNFLMGEFKQSISHFDQVFLHTEPGHRQSHTLLFGLDLYLASQIWYGFNLQMLGKLDQARDILKEELEGARILAHPYMWDMSNNAQSFFYEALGDPDITERLTLDLKQNSEEHNITYGLVLSILHLGWVISCRDQLEEGITQMQQGLSALKSVDVRSYVPFFSTLLIDAYRKANIPSQGLEVVHEIKELIDTTGERYYEAELHRLEGELLRIQGADDIAVENLYNHAIEVARSQSGKFLELRATVSLARLWQSQGRESEAYKKLSEIYTWFTEGFDTKDLREAKSLLDELHTEINLERVG